jgi:hypothetical protein
MGKRTKKKGSQVNDPPTGGGGGAAVPRTAVPRTAIHVRVEASPHDAHGTFGRAGLAQRVLAICLGRRVRAGTRVSLPPPLSKIAGCSFGVVVERVQGCPDGSGDSDAEEDSDFSGSLSSDPDDRCPRRGTVTVTTRTVVTCTLASTSLSASSEPPSSSSSASFSSTSSSSSSPSSPESRSSPTNPPVPPLPDTVVVPTDPGLDALLTEVVLWPRSRAAQLQRAGVRIARGALLHGPRGCGKGRAIVAFCAAYGVPVVTCDTTAMARADEPGDAERILARSFRAAETQGAATGVAVLYVPRIDIVCPARGGDTVGGELAGHSATRVVAAALTLLDGFGTAGAGADSAYSTKINSSDLTRGPTAAAPPTGLAKGPPPAVRVVVLATAANPAVVDIALRRPGRLDREYFLAPPSLEDRVRILRDAVLPGILVDTAQVTAERLASMSTGATRRELEAWPARAASFALESESAPIPPHQSSSFSSSSSLTSSSSSSHAEDVISTGLRIEHFVHTSPSRRQSKSAGAAGPAGPERIESSPVPLGEAGTGFFFFLIFFIIFFVFKISISKLLFTLTYWNTPTPPRITRV